MNTSIIKFTVLTGIILLLGYFLGNLWPYGQSSRSIKMENSICTVQNKNDDQSVKKITGAPNPETKSTKQILDSIIDGTIDEINSNKILFTISPIGPTGDLAKSRVAILDGTTKIYKEVPRDKYKSEKEEYDKKIKDVTLNKGVGSVGPTPPVPFDKIAARETDLIKGQKILVKAKGDIAEQKEFTAIELTILGEIN
jgi:hypothetical protein